MPATPALGAFAHLGSTVLQGCLALSPVLPALLCPARVHPRQLPACLAVQGISARMQRRPAPLQMSVQRVFSAQAGI